MATRWGMLLRRGSVPNAARRDEPSAPESWPKTLAEAGTQSTHEEQARVEERAAGGLPNPPPDVRDKTSGPLSAALPDTDAGSAAGAETQTEAGNDAEPAAVVPPPGLQPPDQPVILGRRRSIVGTAVLFTLGAGVAYVLFEALLRLHTVLVMIALALLIALTLNPLVEVQQKRGVPRWLASLLAWLLAAVVLVTPIVLAVRAASSQLPTFIQSVPTTINNAENHLGSLGDRLRSATSGTTNGIATVTPESLINYLLRGGQVVFDAVGGIAIVGALTLWILIGLPRLVAFLLLLVPASRRAVTREISVQVLSLISRQMITSVVVALIAGASTFGWAAAWGIPYPVLLGSLVAILDLIPTIGSTVGGVVVTLVALSVGLPTAIATLAFYIAFRMTEDYIILPRAMRFSVELPGVVTVPAVLVGGAVLGLPGALFAVPVTLLLRVLVRDIALPALDKR